jgi:NAD-dependent SIR2 family protein deacetylase
MACLRNALALLMPGWKLKMSLDELPLITEVLSLIDYSLAEGKSIFPNQRQDELARVRQLLDRAIYEVLWTEDGEIPQDPQNHKRFCAWIVKNVAQAGGVVTTNYDTCIEQALFSQKRHAVHKYFDFGFSWLDTQTDDRVVRLRPHRPWVRWYKLHGSLNWARCPSCEHIYINPYGTIAHQSFRAKTDDGNTCYCGNKARLKIHLVAPSMYRSVRDANLLEVWKNALQLLIEADHWIFVGYSLPSEDLAIRSMIVRANHARSGASPRITVVQSNDSALSRYKLLFPNCDYFSGGLGAWLNGA